MLRSSPGKLNRNGFGSPPSVGEPQRRRLPLRLRHRHRQAGLAEHDPGPPDRVGHDLVVAGQGAQLGSRLLVEVAISCRLRRPATSRSGSAKTTSKAMAAAPSLVRRVIRSATRVRGHGHWPSLRRLCFVDVDDDDRPLRRDARLTCTWKKSKVRSRSSSSGRGIGDAQDQQRRAAAPAHRTPARKRTAAPDEKTISCRTSQTRA